MELAAIAAQQAMFQQAITTQMVKQNAQAQQSIVEMVAASVDAYRGNNLNITV
ncbi:MAG: hypothetical protein H3C49_11675 [Alphaproteobacteria bacterium]|nr:hypothetical protein [Alphaproteobacteria bacterium]HRI75625.1 hypothetical protein [Alphaproteobacteria bacterium]